jgi:hypothetical protein
MRLKTCLALSLLLVACRTPPDPNKQIPAFLLKFASGSFAYPIGEQEYVTEKNDWRIRNTTHRILARIYLWRGLE